MENNNNTIECKNKENIEFKEEQEKISSESIPQILKNCLKQVKTDPGAPYEPEVINTLKVLIDQKLTNYFRFRNELKELNPKISVSKLDELVNKHKNTSSQEMKNAEILINIVQDNAELFHNKNNEYFVTFKKDKHYETWNLKSSGFID